VIDLATRLSVGDQVEALLLRHQPLTGGKPARRTSAEAGQAGPAENHDLRAFLRQQRTQLLPVDRRPAAACRKGRGHDVAPALRRNRGADFLAEISAAEDAERGAT
jgi:hypothetical protein